jgi:hypothetical protein
MSGFQSDPGHLFQGIFPGHQKIAEAAAICSVRLERLELLAAVALTLPPLAPTRRSILQLAPLLASLAGSPQRVLAPKGYLEHSPLSTPLPLRDFR